MPEFKFFKEQMDKEAQNVWEMVRETRSTNYRLRLGEVTLTEMLFYRLRHFWTKGVYIDIEEPNESITGADWDWFIGYDTRWLQIRVQAKIIDKAGSFKSLGHKNRNGKQIDLLLNPAPGTVTCRWIPLYVFYTATPPAGYKPPVPALHVCNCGVHHVPHIAGCSAKHARDVRDTYVHNKTRTAAQHLPGSIPWSKVFDGLVCRLGRRECLRDIVDELAARAMSDSERDIEKFWDSGSYTHDCRHDTSEYLDAIMGPGNDDFNTSSLGRLIVRRPPPSTADRRSERDTSAERDVFGESPDEELTEQLPSRVWYLEGDEADQVVQSLPRFVSIIDIDRLEN